VTYEYRQLDITPTMHAQIIDLYQRCYAAPPWSETPEQLNDYPANLAASMERPGFIAHTASDDAGRLVGVCYGWPTPADLTGNHVYDTLIKTFGLDATTALTRDAFEVVELFIHPDHQGQGIGRNLLTQATGSWPTAWLITSPQAPAAVLYRKLGWQEAGDLPTDFHPQLKLSVFALPRG
jgi:GNAT superfamily N-acetyltransferase